MDKIELGKDSNKPYPRKLDTTERTVAEILQVVKRIETMLSKALKERRLDY